MVEDRAGKKRDCAYFTGMDANASFFKPGVRWPAAGVRLVS